MMSFIFFVVFILLVHPPYSSWKFPNILDASLQELRTKREASCGDVIQLAAGGSDYIQLRTELRDGFEFYRKDEDCTWSVETPKGHNMVITSEYFRVEESDDCAWDYVEVREKNLVNSRFCGWKPIAYITTGKEIVMQFKSDLTYEYRGFKFYIVSVPVGADVSKCNRSIVGGEDSSIFNKHDVGASCFYRIEAPEGKVIELDLVYVGIASCDEESLLIYKGLTSQDLPLGKICSDAVKGIQPFHVNTVFIEYRNQLGKQGLRFLIKYAFVDATFTPSPRLSSSPSPVGGNNDCSGVFNDINTANEDIVYTAPEYQSNKECVVLVNTQLPQHVVQIHFNYFKVEDSEDCMFDSLRILSGERNDSEPLGGPYCGRSLNGRTFVTNGNSIRLEFRTDVSFALRGFQAAISFIPKNECRCKEHLLCIRQGFDKICIPNDHCHQNISMTDASCLMLGSKEICLCPTGYKGVDWLENEVCDAHKESALNFTKAPSNRSLAQGQSHIQECSVEVPPGEEVEYYWTLNGYVITPFDNDTNFGSHSGGILEIRQFSDDLSGTYSCIALTSSKIAHHTFHYKLERNRNTSQEANIVLFEPQNIDEIETHLRDAIVKNETVFFTDNTFSTKIEKYGRYFANVSLIDMTIFNQKHKPKERKSKPPKGNAQLKQLLELRDQLQSLIGQSPILTIENFQNWGENQQAQVIKSYPETMKDIIAVINAINEYPKKFPSNNITLTLRCTGAGHSWGPLFVDNGGLLLDMSKLQSDYPNKTKIRLHDGNLVDVMTGVTTGELKQFQLENKVNLPCNVILDVVQMVSVVASGCHGVGWDSKTPGDYIKEMRIVQADGQLHKYTSEDEDMMNAIRANFGVFGIIIDITLQLVDEVKISTETKYETLGNILLDPENLGTLIENNWSVEIFWFPFNSNDDEWDVKSDQVWIRNINPAPANTSVEGNSYYSKQDDLDLITQYSLQYARRAYLNYPQLVPLLAKAAFWALKHVLYPQGTIYQELVHGIHFRNHIHMVPVRDMEFAFDMKKTADGKIDFQRVRDIIKVVIDATESFYKKSLFPLNIALEMRFMSYSDSFMNPASIGNPKYGGSGHVFYIEVLSLTGTPNFQDFCIQIAKKWMSSDFNGMPHLAKEWDYIPGITEYIQKRMKQNIGDFKAKFTKGTAKSGSIMINSALQSLLEIGIS